METRRKQEEAERLRLEEEDRRAALLLQAQLEKEAQEDTQYRQLMEQERRDHELALRLAQESNGQIEESPTMSRKYVENYLFFYSDEGFYLYKEKKFFGWIRRKFFVNNVSLTDRKKLRTKILMNSIFSHFPPSVAHRTWH